MIEGLSSGDIMLDWPKICTSDIEWVLNGTVVVHINSKVPSWHDAAGISFWKKWIISTCQATQTQLIHQDSI